MATAVAAVVVVAVAVAAVVADATRLLCSPVVKASGLAPEQSQLVLTKSRQVRDGVSAFCVFFVDWIKPISMKKIGCWMEKFVLRLSSGRIKYEKDWSDSEEQVSKKKLG
ncbi:MAG: hypothetical protein JXD22_01610 [Sedimentisphaerales bacterium]|nr:hypothetical protein [Sedimentisphaerales bacterium]